MPQITGTVYERGVGAVSGRTVRVYRRDTGEVLNSALSGDGSTFTIGDRYFASNIALLNFNGTNGSTTITDQSPAPLTASVFGNAALSNVQAKFGTTSLALDGNGDYISLPSNTGFDFGTGDFTVEFFSYWSSAKAISHLDGRGGTASSPRILLYNTDGAPYTDLKYYVSGADRITAPNGTLIPGQWQHIAVSRVAGNTRLFVDGTQVGATWADTTAYTAAAWNIGRNGLSAPARDFNGYIDGFRVTKGVGRYTTTFTPPTTEMQATNLNFGGTLGTYTLETWEYTGEVIVVCQDNSAGTVYNDMVKWGSVV